MIDIETASTLATISRYGFIRRFHVNDDNHNFSFRGAVVGEYCGWAVADRNGNVASDAFLSIMVGEELRYVVETFQR